MLAVPAKGQEKTVRHAQCCVQEILLDLTLIRKSLWYFFFFFYIFFTSNQEIHQYKDTCIYHLGFFLRKPQPILYTQMYSHKKNKGSVITAKLKINGQHHALILSKLQSRFTLMVGPRGQSRKDP